MVEVTEARITQADIEAAFLQAAKGYQTQYDYEMDLRQVFATHREAAAKAERDRIVAWLREAQVEAMKQGKLEASAAMAGFADALEGDQHDD